MDRDIEYFIAIIVAVVFSFGLLFGYKIGCNRNIEKDDTICYKSKQYRVTSISKIDDCIILSIYDI